MAMTSGNDGAFSFSGDAKIVLQINAWNLSLQYSEMSGTKFGVEYQTYACGTYTGSGTFSGFADSTGVLAALPTSAAGISGTLTLTYYTAKTFTGTAFLTNINVGAQRDGMTTVSANYRFAGAITIA